jgi:hypothetical protein
LFSSLAPTKAAARSAAAPEKSLRTHLHQYIPLTLLAHIPMMIPYHSLHFANFPHPSAVAGAPRRTTRDDRGAELLHRSCAVSESRSSDSAAAILDISRS